MKIIIDIPDEEYEDVKKAGGCYYDFGKAIVYGTKLPKGHGDLIDRNELNKDLIANEWITDDYGDGLEEILFNAPTIVEADKSESGSEVGS